MSYGLTTQGFVAKPQSIIIQEIQTSLQLVFGQNINFGPESNFGQLVGIFSEREALLWQLAEAVYGSQYPSGAEGTSVDNILAFAGLRRLKAIATRTDDVPVTGSDSITLYGLVLFGTAGTVIPQGSIVQTSASPPLEFTTDLAVTLEAAKNDIQSLYFSNTPDQGSYALSITDRNGEVLTTPSIQWDAQNQATKISFSPGLSSGAFKITLSLAGVTLSTASIAWNDSTPSIQAKINALAGYSSVSVSGTLASGITLSWNGIPNPAVTITNNTTTSTPVVVDSVQSAINTLYDVAFDEYPYTDVALAGVPSGITFTFGGGPVYQSNPSSANKAQALMVVAANSLQMGSTVTNLNMVKSQQGAPAQAVTTATCTQTGPNFVKAGTIDTVGTSISGWDGVTNQLDCITGRNIETDTEAITRYFEQLQSNANGPLQSIVEKVAQLQNVTNSIGFENLNNAALQVIKYTGVPISGTFKIYFKGVLSSALAYNASSAQVQTEIRAIPHFGDTLVTGDYLAGYTVDFNGAEGGQDQPLMQVVNNTTGLPLNVDFGRPGHSFEIVAEGGAVSDILQQIYDSKPAGIETYGNTSGTVFDAQGAAHTIRFSRPTPVPIYITITMVTDQNDLHPTFNPNSVLTIQQELVAIGKLVGIGGLVIGFGTNGLIGAFNNVVGIKSYDLKFGRSPNPTQNVNVQMQPEEVPDFQTFNIVISYT